MFCRRLLPSTSAVASFGQRQQLWRWSAVSTPATTTIMRLCASASASASMGKGNFFAFFDLPKQPEVDGALLQKRYHALQRQVHPDRENVNASQRREDAEKGVIVTQATGEVVSDEEGGGISRESAVAVSSYANAAYETLKDPFLRCRYLARLCKAQELKGKDTPPLTPAEEEEILVEDDRKAMLERIASPSRPVSEEFLMEMLMMNELTFGGDINDEATLARMKVLLADLKERNEQYHDDAKAAWAAQDIAGYYCLIEEWTYIHNTLTSLVNRL